MSPRSPGYAPGVNSPSNDLGTTRGSWWIAMSVIAAVVIAVIVVLELQAASGSDVSFVSAPDLGHTEA